MSPVGAADGFQPSSPQVAPDPIPDDPTTALKGQIASLQRAEEQAYDPTARRRAQTLAAWQAQGLKQEASDFFVKNPSMLDNPQRVGELASEAQQRGIVIDSPEFFQFVKANFHGEVSPEPSVTRTAPVTRPEPRPHSGQSNGRGSIVSAPPSKTIPLGYSERGGFEFNPNRITLSAAEKEHARIAGVSELEFAEGKRQMLIRKQAGDLQ